VHLFLSEPDFAAFLLTQCLRTLVLRALSAVVLITFVQVLSKPRCLFSLKNSQIWMPFNTSLADYLQNVF